MSQLIIADKHLWLNYFNRHAALAAVAAHVAALPSSRTDEQHTKRAYKSGLEYFSTWIQDDLPTPDLVRAFIAHLVQRNLSSSTIGSKYLAPLRHYLKNLANQMPDVTGAERDFVSDVREHLRQAAAIKTPKPETTTNIAPLWRPEFHRLSINEVNATLRQIDRSPIDGQRDYALLHLAFSTGLRLAEMARITPNSIQPIGDGGYLITVRGKRSNSDPVPISADCYADVMAYIEAYNAPLSADDPRRIVGDVPVWQPLHANRYHFAIGRHDPCKGLSHQSIRDLIGKRTLAAIGKAIAPHDTRRTSAAIAYDSGMPITDLQSLLRHKDAAVTMHYVGTRPDFHKRSLSTYVKFG